MGKFETSSKLSYFNKNMSVSTEGLHLLYTFVINRCSEKCAAFSNVMIFRNKHNLVTLHYVFCDKNNKSIIVSKHMLFWLLVQLVVINLYLSMWWSSLPTAQMILIILHADLSQKPLIAVQTVQTSYNLYSLWNVKHTIPIQVNAKTHIQVCLKSSCKSKY
jgi:hypothetical protein